ncbi:unnamed protein product [Euphydryas editha]|uniref:Peptidase S1 domain-containing protein n=1 Tax=Euphydryas editha TaxID=104508 RepID=A0AAU9TT31_EUPED|nr:unnamed protein product [Euphydryas editha]
MYLKQLHNCYKIFSYLTLYFLSATSHDKTLRIIGGRDAAPGEFPFALKMDLKFENKNGTTEYSHQCTCSLLKSTWSLTAGHCIIALRKYTSVSSKIKGVIRYNISSVHEPPYSYILSTFLHPSFDISSTFVSNDIGLLLSEKVVIFSFAKLSSVDYLSLFGSKVLSLGFGVTKDSIGYYDDAYRVNKSLQVLDSIITKCFITNAYPSFCLGGNCGQSSFLCPGDSGGPVMHTSGLVGINTGTLDILNCGKKVNNPNIKFQSFSGIITPTSHYIDWITNMIQSNSP